VVGLEEVEKIKRESDGAKGGLFVLSCFTRESISPLSLAQEIPKRSRAIVRMPWRRYPCVFGVYRDFNMSLAINCHPNANPHGRFPVVFNRPLKKENVTLNRQHYLPRHLYYTGNKRTMIDKENNSTTNDWNESITSTCTLTTEYGDEPGFRDGVSP
jgi:hypothetical protein